MHRWPTGHRFAVALSFDLDHETPWEGKDGPTTGQLSSAQFGTRVGLPRVLEVLAAARVPATFFVPAVAAARYPAEIEFVATHGHEIALHGLRHERPAEMGIEQERDVLEEAVTLFAGVVGTKPRGYRAPSFDPSEATARLLVEHEFTYDSSMMADDQPYELLIIGEPSGLIEVPVEWTRDDATYFVMDRWAGLRPTATVEEVGAMWQREWRRAREDGGLFQLTLHPDLIGQRTRIHVLEELLSSLAEVDDGWLTTHLGVAKHYRDEAAHD